MTLFAERYFTRSDGVVATFLTAPSMVISGLERVSITLKDFADVVVCVGCLSTSKGLLGALENPVRPDLSIGSTAGDLRVLYFVVAKFLNFF